MAKTKKVKPGFIKDEHLKFLSELINSGSSNVSGARLCLMNEYPELIAKEALTILAYWMDTFKKQIQVTNSEFNKALKKRSLAVDSQIVIKAVNSGIKGKEDKIYYTPVFPGSGIRYLAETPDVAFLYGLGFKYDGVNSQFAIMACRMLGIQATTVEVASKDD